MHRWRIRNVLMHTVLREKRESNQVAVVNYVTVSEV